MERSSEETGYGLQSHRGHGGPRAAGRDRRRGLERVLERHARRLPARAGYHTRPTGPLRRGVHQAPGIRAKAPARRHLCQPARACRLCLCDPGALLLTGAGAPARVSRRQPRARASADHADCDRPGRSFGASDLLQGAAVSAGQHRQAGFTLVEMMVGTLVGTAVSIALASAFLLGYRTISQEARQIAADQAVRTASLPMVRDLTSATTISQGTITPAVGTLTITYAVPVTTVTYRIDARNNLIRTVGGSSTVAARGRARVRIAPPAPACYYTVTLTPSAVGAVAVTLNVSTRVGPQGGYCWLPVAG